MHCYRISRYSYFFYKIKLLFSWKTFRISFFLLKKLHPFHLKNSKLGTFFLQESLPLLQILYVYIDYKKKFIWPTEIDLNCVCVCLFRHFSHIRLIKTCLNLDFYVCEIFFCYMLTNTNNLCKKHIKLYSKTRTFNGFFSLSF